MDKPTIAGKTPLPVELKAGETYAWCSCGDSPKVFKAEKDQTAYMCTCKHTSNPGMCDGTHKNL